MKHIAWLARVNLSKEEEELFTQQFNEILDYFKKIDELDTEKVPPTFHIIDLKNVFREDEIGPSLPIEKALLNAPCKKGRLFKAPKML